MTNEDKHGPQDDFAALGQELAAVSEKLHHLMQQSATQSAGDPDQPVFPDPAVISNAFQRWWQSVLADPEALSELQMTIMKDMMDLSKSVIDAAKTDGRMAPVIEPERGDRRFGHEDWQQNPFFNCVKQSYLLSTRWAVEAARNLGDVDPQTRMMIDFYTRQWANAMAPTNNPATNPEVLRATLEGKGKNLLDGMRNLVDDMELGHGRLKIRMTDLDAFEVGKNIALTPGKVVYQNDFMQLIQYAPTTDKVAKRPLLIIPPWINKFYILDLSAKKSFIRWAVEQGQTVFVVSWVNPDETMAGAGFDDYMRQGGLAALDAIEQATGETSVNVIGYCIGGTLLAATLGYMAARGDTRIHSATFFTTLVDFTDAGEIKVFVDKAQLEALETHLDRNGYLDGSIMSTAFSLLRSNDLIWSYVVRQYLLGQDPMPFDLLYWNSDSTRMPAMMHKFYLRKMYLENQLAAPGGIEMNGVPIDLRSVKTPTYILAAKDDHIAPWESCFMATQLFRGVNKFVLGGSGHIAGVINPAASGKYGFWTSTSKAADPAAWLKSATHNEGSWWPDWAKWISRKSGGRVGARQPGAGDLAVIEDAPGSYVKATTPKS